MSSKTLRSFSQELSYDNYYSFIAEGLRRIGLGLLQKDEELASVTVKKLPIGMGPLELQIIAKKRKEVSVTTHNGQGT